jgi:acylphosphatase
MLIQVRLFVKGEVIGVGFRAWTKIQAKIIGVCGSVKNISNQPDIYGKNGGVEIVVQGKEENIKRFVDVIKEGPPISHVSEVESITEEPKEIFDSFEIRKSDASPH